MARVYPEIVVEEPESNLENTTKTESEKKTFYFISESKKITKIVARDEAVAKSVYYHNILPKMYLPYNIKACFFFPSFEDGPCRGKHCIYDPLPHYFGKDESPRFNYETNMEFLMNLLGKYPDFYDLGRFETMYHETPTMEEGDFENSVTRSDGSVKYFNPKSFTYIWKKANVRCTLRGKASVPFYDAMSVLSDRRYCYEKICYAWILTNIQNITPAQADMLKGSSTPLTDAGLETLRQLVCPGQNEMKMRDTHNCDLSSQIIGQPIPLAESVVEECRETISEIRPALATRRRFRKKSYTPIEISEYT
jgi:hypothetical protein